MLAVTYPSQPTGYARVGRTLAAGLARLGHAVTVFGYQSHGATECETPEGVRVIDVSTAVGDPLGFGFDLLPVLVQSEAPDVLVLYNDVLVVNAFLDKLPTPAPCKLVWYMDLVHEHEDAGLVRRICDRVDAVWAFAPHWKRHLETAYDVPPSKVRVLPHALDRFPHVSRDAARARLGIPPGPSPPRDAFVVLNSNRNSYRKALDVSIAAFFDAYAALGAPPDMFLFLNCKFEEPTGYRVRELVYRATRTRGLPDAARDAVLSFPNAGDCPQDALNALLHACDVGLNTCTGEGFGLCQLEHASLARPQVVTRTGGLIDLFGDSEDCVPPAASLELPRGFIAHGGLADVPDCRGVARRLRALYELHRAGRLPRREDVARAARFRKTYAPDEIARLAGECVAAVAGDGAGGAR